QGHRGNRDGGSPSPQNKGLGEMPRFSVIALVFGSGLFLLTFELTRRRRLIEKYAILWFATAVIIVIVAVVPGALDFIADALGISYAPAALLLVAFIFSLAVTLHLSMVLSRVTRQLTLLAQEHAILQSRVETRDSRVDDSHNDSPA
ncbi:MAG: DUF2304 domain-containing protein, partial [Gaiellales bacterium]